MCSKHTNSSNNNNDNDNHNDIDDDNDNDNNDNNDYHNFVYTPTHGGTGFYVKNTANFKRRVDLEIIPPGPTYFESTFIEIIIPNSK